MRDNFGAYWRRSFKEKMNGLGDGFTTRTYLNVNFVSVGDGDCNYVPSKSNIIAKGSKDAADIRNHIDEIWRWMAQRWHMFIWRIMIGMK